MLSKEKFEEKFYGSLQTGLITSVFVLPFLILVIFTAILFNANTEKFGQVGDFLGGVLNPIFSFISLIVSIFVAFQVKLLTEATINSATQDAKMGVKYDEYKAYKNTLNPIFEEWEKHPENYSLFDAFQKKKIRLDIGINELFPKHFMSETNKEITSWVKEYRDLFEEDEPNIALLKSYFSSVRTAYHADISSLGRQVFEL